MSIFPSKYRNLDLSTNEKKLIENISDGLKSEKDLLLINVNPLGIPHKLHVLIYNNKLSFIHVLNGFKSLEDFNFFALENLKNIMEMNIKKIYFRLTEHANLITSYNGEKALKFPISYKYFAPEINVALDDTFNKLVCANELLKRNNFKNKFFKGRYSDQIINKLTDNVITPHPKDSAVLSETDINNILQMIVPEYTIPFKQSIQKHKVEVSTVPIIKPSDIDYELSDKDIYTKSLRLDEEQINIVNNIRKGNQLILASAGSGKSVLLISKLFKIASMHSDKEFLLLCFNKNLASMYNWRIAISGFREKNVKAMTFHKLLGYLMDKNNLSYNRNSPDTLFETALNYLKEGKIRNRFLGIFIDEIQIFKPEWYRFCYELLETKEQDNYFFVICGDISQNVRNDVKQGSAPWQGHKGLPNYRGRTIHLKKNYRNTIQINNFIQSLSKNAKEYFELFNIDLEEKNDMFLNSKAYRNGPLPRLIETDRFHVAEKVVKEINYLLSKGLQLSDIAILFPQRGFIRYNYHIHYWIQDKLEQYGYEYSNLIQIGDRLATDYSEYNGIVLSTIESALGLDFEAVILTGLLPLGAYHYSKVISKKIAKNKDLNNNIKEEFVESINKIYTACSRARTYLSIILEEDENKSIYSQLIKKSLNRMEG